MAKDEVALDLNRWRAAGLMTTEQVEAILAFERKVRKTGGPQPEEARLTLAEAFAYLGAVVVLAGIAILLVTRYSELGAAGRLGILAAVTAIALAAALLLGRAPGGAAGERARAVALALFDVGAAALIFQVQVEMLGGRLDAISPHDGQRILLLSAAAGSLVAAGLLWRTGAALLAALLAVGTYITGAAFLSYVFTTPAGPWTEEAVFAACGIVLLVGAELSRHAGRRWSTEMLACAAFLVPPVVAYTVARGDQDLALELLGGAIALLAFGAAVLRSSPGYALAGAAGVFGFVLELELRHFRNSFGFALVLIISGLALLAVSYLTGRLIPRLSAH